MTILHSCCCWRSVRKGSFACGIYTAFYYTFNAAHTAFLLHEEIKYFQNSSQIEQSFIDHDTTSETSMAFTITLLTLSTCGVITTILLLYGLHRDHKLLLVPWICNIVVFVTADFAYVIYSLIVHALQWNPPAAIFVTLDFFLNSLHIYGLLCVVSQYQELKAGRGRALDDQLFRVPNVHYSCQPTATSNLTSSRKPTMAGVSYYETRPTPTQSPTTAHPPSGSPIGSTGVPMMDALSLPTGAEVRRGSRKSVKFEAPPSLRDEGVYSNGTQLLDPWSIDAKSSPTLHRKAIDTAPLIETTSTTLLVTQSSV